MLREPIPIKEAVQKVIDHCTYSNTETVSLDDAYGRILAEPILAEHDVPPFNRSAFDGYAIRSIDSVNASQNEPASFRVIGEIGAGHIGDQPLGKKEAYRIMTGAHL